jgi:hypothetical protein
VSDIGTTATPHLWEINHPYYCNEGNYYATGQPTEKYESWADFFDAEGDSSFNLNLVFRWDWRKADPNGENWGNETDILLIFWMGQRKGLYRWSEVQVTDADEAAVKEWLHKRWLHLQHLWQGIAPPVSGGQP